jgi:hypothetical protein
MRGGRASVTVSRMLPPDPPFTISHGLSWRRLRPAETRLACPVIVATGGEPGPAEWVELASRWATAAPGRHRRGVVALQARDGVLVAVFLYRIDPPVPGDLLLPMLRAAEIARSERTLSAALDAAADVAREEGCGRIVIEVDEASAHGRTLEARLAALASCLRPTRQEASWVMALAS